MKSVRLPLLPYSIRILGVLIVLGTISYFSLWVPPSPPAQTTPFWDKYLHVVAYAALAFVLMYATVQLREKPFYRGGLVIGVALLIGALIELIQGIIPNRYFGLGDLLANAFGTMLILIWFFVERHISYVPARSLYRDTVTDSKT